MLFLFLLLMFASCIGTTSSSIGLFPFLVFLMLAAAALLCGHVTRDDPVLDEILASKSPFLFTVLFYISTIMKFVLRAISFVWYPFSIMMKVSVLDYVADSILLVLPQGVIICRLETKSNARCFVDINKNGYTYCSLFVLTTC